MKESLLVSTLISSMSVGSLIFFFFVVQDNFCYGGGRVTDVLLHQTTYLLFLRVILLRRNSNYTIYIRDNRTSIISNKIELKKTAHLIVNSSKTPKAYQQKRKQSDKYRSAAYTQV